MRIAFAGTPEYARTVLQALHSPASSPASRERAGGEAGLSSGMPRARRAGPAYEPGRAPQVRGLFEIIAVLTQPDRSSGRGMKPQPSPVKRFAAEHGLPILQPLGLRLDGRFAADAKACADALREAAPDAIVVAAYGLILPPWLLALPRHGCLNLHASLLPRWRGAAPVQRAIAAGDRETGVVLMQMDAGLDTGAMLLTRRAPIDPADTAATLTARLAAIGGELAVEGMSVLASGGSLEGRPQPAEGASYAAKVTKAEAGIDWREPASLIERRLRAFDPFPGARSTLEGETVTCWRGEVRGRDSGGAPREGGGVPRATGASAAQGAPGEIVALEPEAIVIACGDGQLALTELQRPGGRRLAAAEFLRGRPLRAGARFDLNSR